MRLNKAMRFGLYAPGPQPAPPHSGQQLLSGQRPRDECDPQYVYAIDIRHV